MFFRRCNCAFLPLATVLLTLSVACAIGCKKSTSNKADATATTADANDQNTAAGDPKEDQRIADARKNLTPGFVGARPLPKREKSTATTLFSKLAPETTHLDFAHNWTPPEGYQLEVYQSLPGGGVCVGDYDNDGLPDIYLTQPHVGARIYRNLGDMKFEDTTATAGLDADDKAMGCSFIDIDNDDDLDLFVCNFGEPNKLYINQGDGTFRNDAFTAGLAYKGASVMAAFADYDQDGDLDVYLVTNRLNPTQAIEEFVVRSDDGKLYVRKEHREIADVITPADGKGRAIKAGEYDHFYRNNGDGTFSDVTEAAGMSGNHWGLNAIWWDYNRDGKADLYVSNDFFGPDQLYRNNGDGTFTDVAGDVLPHTPWYSMGTDVTDLNNDGWLDLMGSDMSGSNHYKQKVSMGDMNTTGWFLTHPTPRQYMRNALYINTGLNRFTEVANQAGVANTDWTWSLKFGDLDEDGLVDLYVTNGMNRDWVNTDLRTKSNAQATPEERMKVWLESEQRKDPNLAYKNEGNLKLTPHGVDWGLRENVVSYGAALADLDRDGDLDVVVNNSQSAPGLYRNNSSSSHRTTIQLKAKKNTHGLGAMVSVRTPDGVQQTRFVSNSQGYMSSNESLVHFGLGKNDTIEELTITWPDGRVQTEANLPSDIAFIVSQDHSTLTENKPASAPPTLFKKSRSLARAKHRETAYDDFARQPLLPMQHSQLGPGQAWADVDGDGDDDFFLGGAAGQPGQLHLNEDGKFKQSESAPWKEDAAAEDMGVLLFDADGDGDCDLYVASGGVECEPNAEVLQDRLYLNDGKGDFTKSDLLPKRTSSSSSVCAADYDRDGDLDLFVGGRVIPGQYPLAPESTLLQNDGGSFIDVTDEVAPQLRKTGLVTSAVWSDADGDQDLDLLVTHEWGPVKLYRNETADNKPSARTLVDHTTEAGLHIRLGWFNSIAARDLNGDGDVDYVVGNIGLNTKYHANDEHPTQLYCGDFDDSGNLRLIEAEFEDEKLFPVRGKSCSTNAMPFLADKFTKFHDFAVADLSTIYTKEKLSSAKHFTANSLESGVLLNDGTGTFDFHPLPAEAQIAPAFGLVVTEINGDRFPDLCIAQNFYGPQRETGRMDGGVGLVLLGNGDGTFIPQAATASGVMVVGDAKSLTLADTNNDRVPDLVFGMNDASTIVFERQPLDDVLNVKLIGGTAGANIIVTHDDGTQQTAEVQIGSGYLSQSPAAFQFGNRDSVKAVSVNWADGTTTNAAPDQIENGHISLTPDGR